MQRFIPGKTKVKTEFWKGVTISDLITGLIALAGAGLILAANIFDMRTKIVVLLSWLGLMASMFIPVDEGLRLYGSLGLLFRFMAFKKRYSTDLEKKHYAPMSELTPFLNIELGKYINYGEYRGMVLEIMPLEFGLLNEDKQNMMINTFASGLRRLSEYQSATIVKLKKPMVFDSYMARDDEKFAILNQQFADGEFTKEELDARGLIFEERVMTLDRANRQDPILQDHFYMVVYGADKDALESTVEGIKNTIGSGQTPVKAHVLKEFDLVSFLKSNYTENFNEKEIASVPASAYMKYVLPKTVEFKVSRTIVDGNGYRNFVVSQYPLAVDNGWAYSLFALDKARVVINFHPMQRDKAEKMIDRAIMETETKLEKAGKSSKQIELETQLETMRSLLEMLKNNNEQLFNVNTHIQCKEVARKEIKSILRQNGFRVAEMFGRQVDAYISNSISRLDLVKSFERGMPTTTLAAAFPFVSSSMQDPTGFYIGDNEYPVFIDFFSRKERINSNMMIIGKSGSGKSYATKTLLANLAADKTKIFLLDPEKEYVPLAHNLHGKIIDVGSSSQGMINPFQIMFSLKEDDDEEEGTDDFSTHLQFLEQFFRVVLEGISTDAFELLNTLVVELYKSKGIDQRTDVTKLTQTDFPIFDDLYELICKKLAKEKDDYFKRNYQILQTYVQKFSTGGRNANLWNGYTSLTTTENFILFNFRTMFANRNESLANAQMLLIFKYLNNEIIKNRDYNLSHNFKRQVVVAVDEAHMFIDPKFPVALSFMAEMAKRIRKYEGMQIIITQNIKDFLGSADIIRQSSAIINASQYSLIFQLAPNDMNDLLQLYASSGGLTKEEQDGIVTADKGVCFLITGPLSRTFVHIVALPTVRYMIGEAK